MVRKLIVMKVHFSKKTLKFIQQVASWCQTLYGSDTANKYCGADNTCSKCLSNTHCATGYGNPSDCPKPSLLLFNCFYLQITFQSDYRMKFCISDVLCGFNVLAMLKIIPKIPHVCDNGECFPPCSDTSDCVKKVGECSVCVNGLSDPL